METTHCFQKHSVFTLGLFYCFLPSLSEFFLGWGMHSNPRQGALEDTLRQKILWVLMWEVASLLPEAAFQ